MMMKSSLLSMFLLCSLNALSQQQDPTLAVGQIPYQSYVVGDVDTVNLYNGAVNVHIPLLEYPQVGGKLKLSFSFFWTGKALTYQTYCTPGYDDGACTSAWVANPVSLSPTPGTFFATNGIADDQAVYVEPYQFTSNPPGDDEDRVYSIINFYTADGASHPAIDVPPQTGMPSGGQRSLDGTNFFNPYRQLRTVNAVPVPVCTANCYTTGPDGIIYGGPLGYRQDANGNAISASNGGYLDTAGRTIPGPSSTGVAATATNSSACTGPLLIYQVYDWYPPGVNGGTLHYKFCYVQVTSLIGGAPNFYAEDRVYIQSIVLPSGQTWTFEYSAQPDNSLSDTMGELSKITYPGGGSVSYTYIETFGVPSASNNNMSLWASSRTVNDNNGGGNQKWTYTYGMASDAAGSPTTTVTDPLLNQTVHTFAGAGAAYEFLTQYYDHADTVPVPHKTVETTYQSISIVDMGGTTGPAMNAFPVSVKTTIDNGASSIQTMSYCPTGIAPCGFTYDTMWPGGGTASFGKLAQESVYDYAASGQGTLLNTTKTQYQFQATGGSQYLVANLLNLVASSTLSDTSQQAQTSYGYDETGLGIAGQLGNQTSVSRWLNIGNPNPVKSTTKFNSQGMPTLLTDPNLNQVSISYQCGGSALNQVTKAYLSTTTTPETTSYGYDCYSGKLTSATDPNNVTTTFDYVDPSSGNIDVASRLRVITKASGTESASGTAFAYPSATQLNVAQDESSLGDGIITSGNTYDGLGRIIHQQRPGGYVVDTTYNQVGEVATVSNPHAITATSPTDGITHYY